MSRFFVRFARGSTAACAFLALIAWTGAALAQGPRGDVRFCQSYAANAAGIGDLAIKRNPGCLDYSKGVHNNFKMHYDWCLTQSRSSVQGAENNIRRLAALCTGARTPAAAPQQRAPMAPQQVFTGGRRLTGNCVGRYQEWRRRPGAKAFAVSLDGKRCGWAFQQRSLIEAQTKALTGCGGRADSPCNITEAVQ